jgi:hypothetical protein
VHFDAGYVPPHHSVDDFAQAIRAIGEPIHDRRADEISMAKLLTLLFEVTALFDMQTRTELVMLQKTMVVVEGVARNLDPKLDMWTTSSRGARVDRAQSRACRPDRECGPGALDPRRRSGRSPRTGAARRAHPQPAGGFHHPRGAPRSAQHRGHRPGRSARQPLGFVAIWIVAISFLILWSAALFN